MSLFEGKKGIVFGVANDRSIAWAISRQLAEQGATVGFTHLPDRDERRKNEKKVRKLAEPIGAPFVLPCDVQKESDLDAAFAAAREAFGTIDFCLHSIAFAPPDDLTGPVYDVSRSGFGLSMEISVYSLISLARRCRDLMPDGGSILTLTYYGGERVIPGYNLMGICKAALDCTTRYLASELGRERIRVNALSAGPVRTISAMGVGGFSRMLELYESHSPMQRNISPEEVGKTGMFLLSDHASGITGELVHVDAGYNIMGGPPVENNTKESA